ncbi:MAG: carboxymuconolactone decarboxylase family protein [Granulosicoccus sp.]
MGRISFPTPESMSMDQRAVYDDIVTGPRGRLVGPLRAVLHNATLADRWQRFGQVLRFETSLPAHLNELAILVTARRWNSDLEWAIHAQEAARAGLPDELAEAIRTGTAPDFGEDIACREIYDYARELLMNGDVSDSAHAAVTTRWNEVGVVELTSVIGYYSMVAMILNSQQVPLPADMECSLPGRRDALSDLPPSVE